MITVCNQKEADRDIPKLLEIKDRFGIQWVGISYEPAIGPIDFTLDGLACNDCPYCSEGQMIEWDTGANGCRRCEGSGKGDEWGIDWVIVGAESGSHARPMPLEWASSVVAQCRAAGVACFVKQLSGKGGRPITDINQFPEDLRVREFPG
jgi:hypothetical protein